jgi:hypothetical protein
MFHSSSPTATTKSCRYDSLCKGNAQDNNTFDPSNTEEHAQGASTDENKPAHISIEQWSSHLVQPS